MNESAHLQIADAESPPLPGDSEEISSLPENLKTGLQLSQVPALDGLRAVGAFLVVFYHFGFDSVPGGLGVLVFFVLSGFLITWLLLRENSKSGGISLHNFYVRRSLRIFPAFYSYWVIYVGLVVIFHRRIVWNQAIYAFFYVNNYFQAIHGDPNTGLSHTWSLGIEEQFYLLWAPLFFLLRRHPNRQVWVLSGLIGAVCVHRELLHFVFGVRQSYIYEAFDTRADHLLMGCLLAVLLRFGFLGGFWRVICSRLALSAITTFLLLASVVLQIHLGSTYRDTVAFVVDPFLVALLIVQAIAFRRMILWRWLQFAWVRYLGRISYSVYLYQQLALEPVRKQLAGFPVFIQLTSAVAVVILLASASYFFIERPFLNLKDRFRETPTTLRLTAGHSVGPF